MPVQAADGNGMADEAARQSAEDADEIYLVPKRILRKRMAELESSSSIDD